MRRTILAIAVVVLLAGPSDAADGRLQPVGSGAGVNKRDPARLVSFIACIVPPGTRAVTIIARIVFSHDIRVVEGEHAGCVGSVPRSPSRLDAHWRRSSLNWSHVLRQDPSRAVRFSSSQS